jgi:hypothetical protein
MRDGPPFPPDALLDPAVPAAPTLIVFVPLESVTTASTT